MSLKSNDRIRVIGGPYAGWSGEVLRVDGNPQRVIAVVPVFGKTTTIELRPSQVERIDPGNDYDALMPVRRPSKPDLDNLAVAVPEPHN